MKVLKVLEVSVQKDTVDKAARTASGYALVDTGNGNAFFPIDILPRKNYGGITVRFNRRNQTLRAILKSSGIRSVDTITGLRVAAVKAAREAFEAE